MSEDRTLLKVGSTTFLTIYEQQNPVTVSIDEPLGAEIVEVFIGSKGDDGQELEIRSEGSLIQTKYKNELAWKNLVDLTEIADKSIEMNVNDTHIQWRYVGDLVWLDLIPLSEIRSGIEYEHPPTHPASMIVEDTEKVFISSQEKTELLTMYQTREFIHNQIVSSAMWIVTHNLNRYPSVSVVDTGGSIVHGETEYINENEIRIYFVGAFSGKAYLN